MVEIAPTPSPDTIEITDTIVIPGSPGEPPTPPPAAPAPLPPAPSVPEPEPEDSEEDDEEEEDSMHILVAMCLQSRMRIEIFEQHGHEPPQFDVLFFEAFCTRLPVETEASIPIESRVAMWVMTYQHPAEPTGIQPTRQEVLVNKPVILYSQDTQTTMPVTLNGTPVNLRLTPARYSWELSSPNPARANTTVIPTSDPGSPWPNPSLTHTYQHTGTSEITLTTWWNVEFQVTGTATWTPVPISLTTHSSTTKTIVQHEAEYVLD